MSGHRWVAPPERAVDRGVPRASPRPRRGLGGSAGIPALDGIRALAVALVLADHGGIPGVPGGFIGVDVFFVLSGFLITSLLLDELGRTGAIDLPGFWVRRARRLLPALIIMPINRLSSAPRADPSCCGAPTVLPYSHSCYHY